MITVITKNWRHNARYKVCTNMRSLRLQYGQTNRELRTRLASYKNELTRVQEQLRRKNELCAQLETEAMASDDQHQQQITGLCCRINTLENDLQVINEEDCVREWRRLRLSLDHWVKKNFKDAAKLSLLDYSAMLQSIGTTTTHSKDPVAGNNHQRWAILQAWIMKMLHDCIFLQYFPGLSQCDHELFLGIDQLIFEQSACIYPSKSFTNRYFRRF